MTSTPADPLAGLDERLDRLLLTARDNERFILSTESAKNIVGIVREWLRVHSSTRAPTAARALAEELREYTAMKYAGNCKCGKCQLVPRALVERIYHTLNSAALRNSAPQETRGDEPVAWMVERPSDPTFPRLYASKADADALMNHANVAPRPTVKPLYAAPQQSPRLGREVVAREVDPNAFKSWQGLYDYCIKDGETEDFAKRCADSFHGEAINDALDRADAILALLSPDRGSK